jgi:hypothetical protein
MSHSNCLVSRSATDGGLLWKVRYVDGLSVFHSFVMTGCCGHDVGHRTDIVL